MAKVVGEVAADKAFPHEKHPPFIADTHISVRIRPMHGMIHVMSDARSHILGKLRTALEPGVPFPAAETSSGSTPVTSLDANQSLVDRFIAEVERVKGIVHSVATADEGVAALRKVLTDNQVQRATVWDAAYLPFDGVHAMLTTAGIELVAGSNEIVETAQAGITGCDWAIAATGTLVLSTGAGRSRMASLLPPIHIALMRSSQLIPRLEDWVAGRYADRLQQLRTSSNITLITGSSRTSDIEMQPVFGVHGPLQMHIVVLKDG